MFKKSGREKDERLFKGRGQSLSKEKICFVLIEPYLEVSNFDFKDTIEKG